MTRSNIFRVGAEFAHESEEDHMAAPPEVSAPGRSSSRTHARADAAARAILSAILADNRLHAPVAERVEAGDFVAYGLGDIASAIYLVLEGGVPDRTYVDAIVVSAMVSPDQAELVARLPAWVAGEEDEARVLAYADVVAQERDDQNLVEAVELARKAAHDSSLDARERHSAVADQFQSLQSRGARTPARRFSDLSVKVLEKLATRAEGGESLAGLTTGLSELDDLLSGAQNGKLIVVAARPSIGKTALALTMGVAAAETGAHVDFHSYEMTDEELAQRALSKLSGVDGSKMRSAALQEEDWTNLINAAEHFKELPLTFSDDVTMDVRALRASARRKHRQGKLHMLIVDYLQIMPSSNGRMNREQQVSENCRQLKLLAKELCIPVILLSQLSREVERRPDKRPILPDLRESGAIEQDADVVIFLYRDEFYDPNTQMKGIGEAIVAKQRDGALGTARIGFDGPTTSYYDLNRMAPSKSAQRPVKVSRPPEQNEMLLPAFPG